MNKNSITKLFGVILLALAVVWTAQPQGSTNNDKDILRVGILQLLEHGALDATRNGFIDRLEELGYKEGEQIEITYLNAQADQSNLSVMSQQLVSNESDLIFAIATTAAQSVANITHEIPILTGAVTNLEAAGLVEANDRPNTNVSGTSDMTPIREQLELLLTLVPSTKRIGFLYNSSEANSQLLVELADEIAIELGLETEHMTVTNTNDVSQNMQALVQKVDAIYIPTDNTLASAMSTVGAIATQYQTPIVAGGTEMVMDGGLATLGVDYYVLGSQAAEMAVSIFEGADVSTMPVQTAKETELVINKEMAEAIGIMIPSHLQGGE